MLFFTSDTHFSDPRVLRIDRRPFKSLAEHDEALVANWNEVVGPDDEIWHLGDFSLPRANIAEQLLVRLNGAKHLIIGNNDDEATIRATGWASVQHYAELTIGGRLVVLCHYPFRTWNKIGKGTIDLHGHSHGKLTPIPRQYDVGVDVQDYRPATLETIMARRRRRLKASGAVSGD
jgi:calcineurin-like phosphoesterase family protein